MNGWNSLKARAAFVALGLSMITMPIGAMVSTSAASADDIPVVANVITPSPAATFDVEVDLPIGESAETAPSVVIKLSGLEPYSFVQIFAQSEPILIASGFADKDGEFRAKVQLPPTLESGAHSIVALAQKEGESVAKSVTLAKFNISESGTIGKSNSSNSGSTGTGQDSGNEGGVTEPSGNDSGGSQSPSAEPTPKPTDEAADIAKGVILVSGLTTTSVVSINPLDQTLRIILTLRNNHKTEIPVSVSASISNFLGVAVAESSKAEKFVMLSNQTRSIKLKPIAIGHWGFYTAQVKAEPLGSVNGPALQPLIREVSFFSAPVLPMTIASAVIAFEFVKRLVAPLWRRRKFQLAFVRAKQDDGEAK